VIIVFNMVENGLVEFAVVGSPNLLLEKAVQFLDVAFVGVLFDVVEDLLLLVFLERQRGLLVLGQPFDVDFVVVVLHMDLIAKHGFVVLVLLPLSRVEAHLGLEQGLKSVPLLNLEPQFEAFVDKRVFLHYNFFLFYRLQFGVYIYVRQVFAQEAVYFFDAFFILRIFHFFYFFYVFINNFTGIIFFVFNECY